MWSLEVGWSSGQSLAVQNTSAKRSTFRDEAVAKPQLFAIRGFAQEAWQQQSRRPEEKAEVHYVAP